MHVERIAAMHVERIAAMHVERIAAMHVERSCYGIAAMHVERVNRFMHIPDNGSSKVTNPKSPTFNCSGL